MSSFISDTKNIHINSSFPPLIALYHIIKLPVRTVTSIVHFNLTAELDSNVLPVGAWLPLLVPSSQFHPAPCAAEETA